MESQPEIQERCCTFNQSTPTDFYFETLVRVKSFNPYITNRIISKSHKKTFEELDSEKFSQSKANKERKIIDVEIRILETYTGDKYPDLCTTEIYPIWKLWIGHRSIHRHNGNETRKL